MSMPRSQDTANDYVRDPAPGKYPTLVVPGQPSPTKILFLGKPPGKPSILKIAALVIFGGLLPGFVLGAWVVGFRVPPYDFARDFYWDKITRLESLFRKQTKYNSIPREFRESDAASLIRIGSQEDVISKRKALQTLVWGQRGLPTDLQPSEVKRGVIDKRYSDLKNLKSIDKIVIKMDHGLESVVYHFIPQTEGKTVLLYHEGHVGDFVHGKRAIGFFLEQGYAVVALSMPLLGMNNQPRAFVENVGYLRLVSHDHLKMLDRPLAPFLEPVCVTLNYLQKRFKYENIAMMGFSGGGWTTQVYSAIDTRVSKSYPISGSLPIHLRSQVNAEAVGGSWGDYEQTLPDLLRIANYLELYVMGAHGQNRRQLQILNKYDSCCYFGITYLTFEEPVKRAVRRLGKGGFAVFSDDTHRKHQISDESLTVICRDLNTGSTGARFRAVENSQPVHYAWSHAGESSGLNMSERPQASTSVIHSTSIKSDQARKRSVSENCPCRPGESPIY
jgi:hypothetical protein